MDRFDPNQWTVEFATENRGFCIREIREINDQVINCLEQGEHTAAIAGLDRILNGLVTLIHAGCDCRSEACFFSWVEANIMLFGSIDAPNENIIRTARKTLLDARDFAKSEQAKNNIREILDELNRGYSVSALKSKYGTEFPKAEIQMLMDMHEKLDRHCVAVPFAPAVSNPMGRRRKHAGVIVVILMLVLAAVVGLGIKWFFAPVEKKQMDEIPEHIAADVQTDGEELVTGETVTEDNTNLEQMATVSSTDENADDVECIVGSWKYTEINDGATTPDGEPLPATLLVLEYWFYDNGRCGQADSFYEEADKNGQQYAEYIDGRYWICIGGGGQEGSYSVNGNRLTITTDESVQYSSDTSTMTFTLDADYLTLESPSGAKTYTRTKETS